MAFREESPIELDSVMELTEPYDTCITIAPPELYGFAEAPEGEGWVSLRLGSATCRPPLLGRSLCPPEAGACVCVRVLPRSVGRPVAGPSPRARGPRRFVRSVGRPPAQPGGRVSTRLLVNARGLGQIFR